MTWSWRYSDADGQPVPRAGETFATKADAESWLGEAWRELLDSGVQQVVLVEGDRVEYDMPLTPAD